VLAWIVPAVQQPILKASIPREERRDGEASVKARA
jgi:hypothetical protein